ncbi:MAG TPA: DUF6062 family protein [Candidatus Limnocylindria bacterium]|nr:DUF6062 family protein [Candidatus Limnocylindria bacterium]
MRYHIDTIPVWDALKQGGLCPLCRLKEGTERLLVSRALGGSVMSPDIREQVNRLGFCAAHHRMLYDEKQGNRLGHALMTLSHLQALRPRAAQAVREAKAGRAGNGGGFFSRRKSAQDGETPASGLASLQSGCSLCEGLEAQEEGQLASLVHLWKTDESFRAAFAASRGLCVPHTAAVFRAAPQSLSGERLDSLLDTAGRLLEDSLRGIEEDLDRFTRKFDYRNADMPWNGAKDALERAMNTLRGRVTDSGPQP